MIAPDRESGATGAAPPASRRYAVAEPTSGDDGAAPERGAVLTHPAFDRPPVQNERRRGNKAGAVSLAVVRRKRQAASFRDAASARCCAPVHDLMTGRATATPERAALAGDELIGAALACLDARLRRPGAVFESPHQVREFLALQLAARDREAFAVLFLDGQHALIEFAVMFEGTLTQTSVYPREVVRRALMLNASAVILAHNHPSGMPEPSRADEHLTQALKAALSLVEVHALDHMIVGRLCVVSMAERGLM